MMVYTKTPGLHSAAMQNFKIKPLSINSEDVRGDCGVK